MAGNTLEMEPEMDPAEIVRQNNDTEAPARSFWARYRLPIILAVIAVCFYGGSIVSIIYGRGGAA